MENRFEKFSCLISNISQSLHKIASVEMDKYELKGPMAIYLLTIFGHNEYGLTLMQLSEYCNRDKADVSRAIAHMQKKGLVVKEGKAVYRTRIKLTELGLSAAEDIRKLADDAAGRVEVGLSESELDSMYFALETISENLRLMSRSR